MSRISVIEQVTTWETQVITTRMRWNLTVLQVMKSVQFRMNLRGYLMKALKFIY